MTISDAFVEIHAVKDGSDQRKIPTAWRPVLEKVVRAFAEGDYLFAEGLPGVEAISLETAAHIRAALSNYGAKLTALPSEAWESSVCMWYGTYWDAMIDLWMVSEGPSDLVLSVRVHEASDGFSFKIQMVYVP